MEGNINNESLTDIFLRLREQFYKEYGRYFEPEEAAILTDEIREEIRKEIRKERIINENKGICSY